MSGPRLLARAIFSDTQTKSPTAAGVGSTLMDDALVRAVELQPPEARELRTGYPSSPTVRHSWR